MISRKPFRSGPLVAIGIAASLALAPAAVAQFYVDPVGGVDQPGSGTSAQPYKTLTACVSNLPPGQWTVRILPGICSVFTGEVFPILLPDRITIEAVTTGATEVLTTIVGDAIPSAFALPPTATYAEFRGFRVKGNAAAIGGTVAAGVHLELVARDARLDGGWGMVLAVAGSANVLFEDCELSGVNAATRARAEDGGQLVLGYERCRFDAGSGGLDLASVTSGSLAVTVASSVFEGQSSYAIRSKVDTTASADYAVDHCVFAFVGTGMKATIHDLSTFGGLANHTIRNSVFHACPNPLPTIGPTYSVTHCLFPSNPPPGTGNFAGDASFVAPDLGDFHLRPGSIAIGAGGPTSVVQDFEGDPRSGDPATGQAGAPDVGADEFYAAAFYFVPDVVSIDASTDLVAIGPPGSLVVLAMAADSNGAGFGQGFQLAVPAFFVPLTTMPPSGALTVTFPPTLNISYIGLVAQVQLAFAQPPLPGWSLPRRTIAFVP
jgi:hypothetical protein